MSGQTAQMNQVPGTSVGVGVSIGAGGADGLPQHQPMQEMAAFSGTDQQFLVLRIAMREKIFEYIARKQSSAQWRKRWPELAKRLEEILYGKFPNKTEYYNMMKGPIEPQLQFAIKTLSAQNLHNQQNPQLTRQIASSSAYGTMIPTPGMAQGSSASSRIPYVADSNALSSSGGGMVPQNANMGASMQGTYMVPQTAQMNQVPGTGVGIGVVGVGGADGLPQHQPMQEMAAFSGMDQQFVMLWTTMREKIFEFIGRKQTSAEWQKRLPELAKRLEVLYRKFPNKNDYYIMMMGPIEPQLQFAIRTLTPQNHQNQQNPQVEMETPPSSSSNPVLQKVKNSLHVSEGQIHKKLRCQFCKKIGHFKKDCLKKKKWFKKKEFRMTQTISGPKKSLYMGIE